MGPDQSVATAPRALLERGAVRRGAVAIVLVVGVLGGAAALEPRLQHQQAGRGRVQEAVQVQRALVESLQHRDQARLHVPRRHLLWDETFQRHRSIPESQCFPLGCQLSVVQSDEKRRGCRETADS